MRDRLGMMRTTFGVEEEFVLLDPGTLKTVDLAGRAVADLSTNDDDGAVVHEFFPSQLEYVSPVFETTSDARHAVAGFRSRLAAWSEDAGVIVAGAGTPFDTHTPANITTDDRYDRIAADIGGLTARHQINGLHVHVGIADRDQGVRVLNSLRPWLPTLLALSANSPFWHGLDTGFESWRAIHSRRWTTYGIPPHFHSADDYTRTVQSLAGIGATSDEGTINWNIRLSRSHPTVEVRVFDAQLDGSSSVALALLVRALAQSESLSGPDIPSTVLDAALWHAARYGVAGTLFNPLTGNMASAGDVVSAVQRTAFPALEDHHDRQALSDFLTRVLRDRQPALTQRRARSASLGDLARLYRTRLAA